MIEEKDTPVNQEETPPSVPSTVDTETRIANIKCTDDLNEFLPEFNLSIIKKQVSRITKREEILDKINDELLERVTKRPYELTAQELSTIDKNMSEQVRREIETVNNPESRPAVAVNNTQINVTVNDGLSALSPESREKTIDALKALMAIAKGNGSGNTEPETTDDN